MMNRASQAARRARRRLLGGAMVRAGGFWLAVGSGSGLALVLASRLVDIGLPWWWLLAAPVAAGAVGGALVGVLGRDSLLTAADRLDRRLNLRDRISTGLSLASAAPTTDPFAQAALAESDNIAAGINVAAATPIRFGPAWALWPVLGAGALAVGLFAPQWRLSGAAQRQQRARETTQVVQSQVQAAIDAVRAASPAPGAVQAGADDLDELAKIQQELARGTLDPQRAGQRAVQNLTSLAESAQERARRLEADANAARDQLARAGQTGLPATADQPSSPPAPQSELARALRSGDFAAASAAARQLMQTSPGAGSQVAGEELEQLARDLDELERQSKPPAETDSSPRSQDPPESKPSQASETQGLTPARQKPAIDSPSSPPAEAQPSSAQSASTPPPTSEPQSGPADARPAPSRSMGERLRDALREAARELKSNPPAQTPDPDNPPASTPKPEQDTPRPPSSDPATPPSDAQSKPSSAPNSKQTGQTDQTGKRAEEPAPSEQSKPATDRQSAPGTPSGTPSPKADPSQQRPKESDSSASSRGEPSQQQDRVAQPSSPQDTRSADKPGQRQPPTSSQPRPANQSGSSSSPSTTGSAKQPDGSPSDTPSASPKPSDSQKANGTGADASKPRPQGEQPQNSSPTAPQSDASSPESSVPSNPATSEAAPEKNTSSSQSPSPAGAAREPKPKPSQPNDAAPPAQELKPSSPSNSRDGGQSPSQRPAPKPSPSTSEKQPTTDNSGTDHPTEPSPRDGPKSTESKPSDQNAQSPPSPESIPNLPKNIPEPNQQAVKRLADELDRLSRARDGAARDRRNAEDLQRRAQELADKLSPDQKQKLEQWGKALASEMQRRGEREPGAEQRPAQGPRDAGSRDAGSPDPGPRDAQDASAHQSRDLVGGPPPGRSQGASTAGNSSAPGTQPATPDAVSRGSPQGSRTELVDARATDSPKASSSPPTIAAEWLGAGSRQPGKASSGDLRRTIEQSARNAERAVEDRAVPRRFDKLLERYFRRLPDDLVRPGASGSPAPEPTPAKDAP